LEAANRFILSRPPDEVGCLYFSRAKRQFVEPTDGVDDDAVPHYGRPCGVWPTIRPL
jgi:hypothetical protein